MSFTSLRARTNRVLGTGVLAAFLASPALAEAQWNGTERDSAGVRIVENTNQGLWSGTNKWRVEQSMLIGSAEGDPDYEFGQVAGIAVGDDGSVYVFDQQAQQIRVFDSEGYFVDAIGGPGGGPGEIGAGAGPVVQGPGDTLLVPDIANRRVDVFTTDGSSAGSWVLDISGGIPLRWESNEEGLLAVHLRPLNVDPNQPADSMDAVVLKGVDGVTRDTILEVPSGNTFSFSGGVPRFNFFSPEPAWTLGAAGSRYFGVNDEYSIRYYNADGTVRLIARKPYAQQPVTSRDTEAFVRFIERAWTDQGLQPEQINVLKQNIDFADNYPAFLQFLSGPANSLWVQQIQRISDLTEEEAENFNPLLSLGGSDWDVFDSEGRYLGEINMPSRFQPLRFVGNEIYGVWRDEFDVQYVLSVTVFGVPGGDS